MSTAHDERRKADTSLARIDRFLMVAGPLGGLLTAYSLPALVVQLVARI